MSRAYGRPAPDPAFAVLQAIGDCIEGSEQRPLVESKQNREAHVLPHPYPYSQVATILLGYVRIAGKALTTHVIHTRAWVIYTTNSTS